MDNFLPVLLGKQLNGFEENIFTVLYSGFICTLVTLDKGAFDVSMLVLNS
jgi:hypothetical protein